MDKLHLTELINVDMLQQIQDAFSNMAGVAALTTDSKGVAVTQGSNFTDFCTLYTRMSELGKKRCEECDRKGAEMAIEKGSACIYKCHAGLVDFAAPIMANGKMVGSFIGGQVLVEPPDLEEIAGTAKELGIDPDEYVEAVKKVRIVDKQKINNATQFLYVVANVLSDIAYKSHNLYINNIEIENASHMKSDFLANMSHEIRTPMNAVLGMADLALREEMSSAARDYIHQIKASAKNLLVIINDILDFSKIESGKMDIVETVYEPLSLTNDLINVINSRISQKNLEFTVDVNPSLPKTLWGDNIRIHQIILNLLNNAVKFTREGEVHMKVDYTYISEEDILLKIDVRDTGIGIKEEDLDRLFNSFQQLDSTRNRNIEGTGLGLSITQQLLHLMKSEIFVKSEYNKGSTFYFELPQKVMNNTPSVPKLEQKITAAILINNKYTKKQLIKDLLRIGAEYIDLESEENFENLEFDYFIAEKPCFTQKVKEYMAKHNETKGIVIDTYTSRDDDYSTNIRIIHKPVFSLNLYNAMGLIDLSLENDMDNNFFTFTAPDAHILIVDDNSVNLTVAKGLVEPFEMNVDTALSAREALEKTKQTKYDIVFMDHMMPEIDGVEATHMIRETVPGYENIPIIALTANAVSGTKEMFLSEGMNDFIPKPIDMKDMTLKLKKWLPGKKLIFSDKAADQEKTQIASLNIPELNAEKAISLLGNERLFMTVLKEYYFSIDKKSEIIQKYWEEQNWRNYTIEVHSLKSISKQIGAEHVSALAAEMEAAGNNGDIKLINSNTRQLLNEYRKYKEILGHLFDIPEASSSEVTANDEEILKMLDDLTEALDNFDILQIDEVIEEMNRHDYEDMYNELFSKLKVAAEESDIQKCSEIAQMWKEDILNKN